MVKKVKKTQRVYKLQEQYIKKKSYSSANKTSMKTSSMS